nr:metalloregulator ArsR/SmtB family transcription factor [Mahella sp.]
MVQLIDNTGDCEEVCVHHDIVDPVKANMLSDEEAIGLAEIFKALGDVTRVKILYLLANAELCVCDIADALNMTQSAISHQLRVLRDLRLVKFRKDGKSVFYSLDDEHILQLFSQGLEHIEHQ